MKRTLLQGLLLSSIASTTALAVDNTLFNAEDIFSLEYANNIQLSPNGKQIAYIRNAYEIMTDGKSRDVWLIDTETGKQVPLFSDDKKYSQLVWSPGGSKLAFVSNMSGSYQIHVHYLKENRTAMVSQLQKGIGNLTWSPDGKWLAFTQKVSAKTTSLAKMPKKPKGAKWAKPVVVIDKARYQADGVGLLKPGYQQVFVLPSEGGTARQLTSGNFNHGRGLEWAKDSKSLVFSANRLPDWEYKTLDSDLFSVDLSGKLTQLTDMPGREYNPSFSRDGKTLAYLTTSNALNPYRNAKLNLMNWRTKESTLIAKNFDRSIRSPQWISQNELAISYDDFGKRKVAKINRSGKISDLTDTLSGTTLGRP